MDETRFKAAVARALLRERAAGGIGTLGEKTLHSALKFYYEPNMLSHEQKAGSSIADVMNEDGIIEVQTGSLAAIRGKLEEYLKTTPVTVVHPVVRKKAIVVMDAESGSIRRSRSSKVGRLEDAYTQLMYLGPLPLDPKLTIAVPVLDIEEQRLAERTRSGRVRYTKLDKVPTALVDEVLFTKPEDHLRFVPQRLLDKPGGFTVAELRSATRYRDSAARALLYTLMNMGLITRERQGRGYVYLPA